MTAIIALIIINKAGGLVYNRSFTDGLSQISTNDFLVLAGTFHGVHAITARLDPLKAASRAQNRSSSASSGTTAGGIGGGGGSREAARPEPPAGLEVLESENFRLQCFTSLTGIKFMLITDTTQTNVDAALRRVYDLYADYVMKNPFYQLEMPVRCDMFDRKLLSYVREVNNR